MLIIVDSCRNNTEKPSFPELKIDKKEVVLEVGQSEKISISGGNGKYEFSPEESPVAKITFENNALLIEAKKAGEQTFTITSADKKESLKVEVREKPIPELGNTMGVYGKDNTLLFVSKLSSKTKKGRWFNENMRNPYEGKRIFIGFYTEGDSEILIISQGLAPQLEDTPEDGRMFPVIKEKDLDNGTKVQLRSGDIRFIIDKKK